MHANFIRHARDLVIWLFTLSCSLMIVFGLILDTCNIPSGRVLLQPSFIIKFHLSPRNTSRPIGWWNTEIIYKHMSLLFARFLRFLLWDYPSGFSLKFQNAASGEDIETALARSWASHADCQVNVKRDPWASACSRHHCLLQPLITELWHLRKPTLLKADPSSKFQFISSNPHLRLDRVDYITSRQITHHVYLSPRPIRGLESPQTQIRTGQSEQFAL